MKNLCTLLAITLLLTTGLETMADDAIPDDTKPSAAVTAFERLKALEGTWRSEGEHVATNVYGLTGNGTVITERYSRAGGNDHDMLTVYHLDGDRLLLTHYCIADNQPRMVATFDAAMPDMIRFEFLDATGLGSPAEGHMHRAVFELLNDNRMTQQWTFYQDGKPVMDEVEHFTRIE